MSPTTRRLFLTMLAIGAVLRLAVAVSSLTCSPQRVSGASPHVLAQDAAVCREGSYKVYQQPGGPGGVGCVCARLASRDGANVATLRLFDKNGSEMVVTSIPKGSGPNRWADTWEEAGCAAPEARGQD